VSVSTLKRIPFDELMAASHNIWLNTEMANKVALEATQIINKSYARKFSFFNGKSSRSIVGGLYYLLGFRHNAMKRQVEIADKLGTSDVSIRKSYRLWLEAFPDLFLDVIGKFADDKDHRSYILLTLNQSTV